MRGENAIIILEESVKLLRIIVPALESKTIRQAIALQSIVDLVGGCELNGDSDEELRKSVDNIMASIKAVAESALQKGPAQ